MSLRHHLRLRDERSVALELLRDRHLGSEIVTIDPDDRYLYVHLQDEQGRQFQAWLNIDIWLQEMDVHLPDIPWGEVPLDYLARWLNHLQLSFMYADNVMNVLKIVTPSTPLPQKAVLLPMEPIPLLCLDWPDSHSSPDKVGASATNLLPFRLHYVLGYSSLTFAQLADVDIGDLLLIKQNVMHLSVGGRRLYRLSYQLKQEVIVEEILTEHHLQHLHTRDEEESLHDWSALQVELEFVMDGGMVTLAELDGITPGTALTLKPDAEQNIKIYLNKKLFARGELVALENGTLAVEVSHINPTLAGHAEDPDAQ